MSLVRLFLPVLASLVAGIPSVDSSDDAASPPCRADEVIE